MILRNLRKLVNRPSFDLSEAFASGCELMLKTIWFVCALGFYAGAFDLLFSSNYPNYTLDFWAIAMLAGLGGIMSVAHLWTMSDGVRDELGHKHGSDQFTLVIKRLTAWLGVEQFFWQAFGVTLIRVMNLDEFNLGMSLLLVGFLYVAAQIRKHIGMMIGEAKASANATPIVAESRDLVDA